MAKGIIAIGNFAVGVVSIAGISFGNNLFSLAAESGPKGYALLVGINSDNNLNSTPGKCNIDDVTNMKAFLGNKFGYEIESLEEKTKLVIIF